MEFSINYTAVLIASVANMVIGFLWYGPLFGKAWQKLIGKSQKDLEEGAKGRMPYLYGSMIVSALILNYVLAHFVQVGNAADAFSGAMIGFWAWLGFVATTSLGGFTWSKRPMNLYYLENGYHLVSFAVAGAILAVLG